MGKKQPRVGDAYTVSKIEVGDQLLLVLSPVIKCGYEPISLRITKEQWDAVQYEICKRDIPNHPDYTQMKRIDFTYIY